MKTNLFLLFFICFCSSSYAQSGKSVYPEDRRWMLSVNSGVNVNLLYTSSNPYSELFSSRKDAGFSQGYRLTHLFTKKFGWYANLQLNVYREDQSEYYDSHIGEDIARVFALPFIALHPSFDMGMVYRLEHGRWKIHPELGVGYSYYLETGDRDRDFSRKNGVRKSIHYKQHAAPLFMNAGFSANYFVSRRCFFSLHASYWQPLQKSYARLITYENDVEVDRISYKTSKVGRSINASLGFGFTVGKRRW